MDSVEGRNAQQKRAKSRSGCKACKIRRIKCDETHPSCLQCTRRKVSCPGYSKTFSWSYKHQVPVPGKEPSDSQSGKNTIPVAVATDLMPSDSAFTTESQVPQPQNQQLLSHCFLSASPAAHDNQQGWPTDVLADAFDELLPSFDNQGFFCDAGADAFALASWPPIKFVSDSAPDNIIPTGSPGDDWAIVDASSPSPSCDLVFCNPAFALKYFGETICDCLCACQPLFNPMRSITMSRVRHSPLFNSLVRYLTAVYLSRHTILDETWCLITTTQKDTFHHIRNEVNLARKGDQFGCHMGTKVRKAGEEALLALMMFGMASSWDGSNNTGISHYRAALSLYTEVSANFAFANRRFYAEVLIYWWMGLSFVTNVEVEPLPDPPPCQGVQNGSKTYNDELRLLHPHPLTGISPEANLLLGKVAGLVYSQRIRAMRPPFLSTEEMIQDEVMLQASYSLEEDLLSLHVPQPTDLFELDNTDTPINDLRNMAEAYRLSGLLTLYRCFPNMLRNRRASLESQESTGEWLRALALHILSILESNASNSKTRSIEQIILVIIANELVLPPHRSIASTVGHLTNFQTLPTMCDSGPVADLFSLSQSVSQPFFEGADWLADVAFSNLPPSSPESGYGIELHDENVSEIIQQARDKVIRRFEALKHILPYRSVGLAEELIHNVWRRDRTYQESFWMDIMIQNNWKFILV